jgi:hypothetical protein
LERLLGYTLVGSDEWYDAVFAWKFQAITRWRVEGLAGARRENANEATVTVTFAGQFLGRIFGLQAEMPVILISGGGYYVVKNEDRPSILGPLWFV